MPAYEYTCNSCHKREVLISGIDDHAVACQKCGDSMIRQDDVETLLASYHQQRDQPRPPQV